MDIRRRLAEDAAGRIGAAVLEECCDRNTGSGARCRFPLVMKHDQDIAFCWFCTTDRRTAERGRTLLLRIKLANQGVLIRKNKPSHDHKPTLAKNI